MNDPRARVRPTESGLFVALVLAGALAPRVASAQTNPSGVGSTNSCGTCVYVSVTPGTLPPSTGIVVTIDLSALGGSVGTPLLDDGTQGDVTASDNIASLCPIPASSTPIILPFVILDAQFRVGTGSITIPPLPTCSPGGGPPVMSLFDVTGVATNTAWSISIGAQCCFGLYISSVPGVAPSGLQSTDEANLRDAFVNAANAVCPGIATPIPFNGSSTLVYGRFAITTDCISGAFADVGVGPAGTAASSHCLVALGNPAGCTFNPTLAGTAGSGLDCDNDGTDDSLQIALCTSFDTDQNAVIDTCEGHCGADLDNGLGGGVRDGGVDINDLIYFLDAFVVGALWADIDNDADLCVGQPDGAPDINDLLYFLGHFEIGC